MSYCDFVATRPADDVHRIYHDHHYGVPIADDNELFCRLVLEINQAGLSWDTILKKEITFRAAYDHFDIPTVAAYGEEKPAELLANAGIIRNRLKVRAAIHNAQQLLQIKADYGSFKQWLDVQEAKTLTEWTKVFKKTFTFVGGEIVSEFLMSTGYLPGAHKENCYRHKELTKSTL